MTSINPPGTENRFFNRELSWLAFNRRVLEEAQNAEHPLLERLNFLSISASNLDEFFMVRVAGLKGHQFQNIENLSIDGRTPGQQLQEIEHGSNILIDEQEAEWRTLSGELADAGIAIVADAEGAAAYSEELEAVFRDRIFAVLTPQVLDPAHPFPFVSNKGLCLIFRLQRKSDKRIINEVVMIPPTLDRFILVPSQRGLVFVTIEAIVELFCDRIFPGYDVLGMGRFRIIRDSDIELEEEAEDLVLYFRSAIKRRRRGRVVRMEIGAATAPELDDLLRRSVVGHNAMVVTVEGLIGLADLHQMATIDRPDLKFASFSPRFPERIREHGGDCFSAIRSKDIVVHHPYETFDVVLSFLRQAADDPDVIAIKQTLYRAGKQSAVIRALIDAADAGKSVTAIVELKARFDEEQNIFWADELERAGVQVVFGFVEWKTHAKLSMVVRREGSGQRTYCHFGTGNYHPVTAKIYTDISYFTADPALGRDVAQLFNYTTGYVEPDRLEKLYMSPLNLRARVEELIGQETANAKAGQPAAIWAKMNALVDRAVIEKLYEASAAGVQIDLIVRGICCLRPGVEGLSENIRVKSVVGRFLEHSRMWAFANGKPLPHNDALVFVSSADWMPRNFDRRVEYMLPVENPTVHDQILDQVLVANLIDNKQSWVLRPDGSYERVASDKEAFNLHRYFMTNPSLSGRGKVLRKRKDVPRLRLGQTRR